MCVWCDLRHARSVNRKGCPHDRGWVRACKEWRCALCGCMQQEIVKRPNDAPNRGDCHYCEASAATRDHIVPRGRGGPNRVDNYVPSCYRCNNVKADRPTTCRCDWCVTALVKYWPELASTIGLVAPTCESCGESMAVHVVSNGDVICPLQDDEVASRDATGSPASNRSTVMVSAVSGPLSVGEGA